MPFVRQQESRTPVDKRVRRHLEEELKPSDGFGWRPSKGTPTHSSALA
jgi:hypothetical protein